MRQDRTVIRDQVSGLRRELSLTLSLRRAQSNRISKRQRPPIGLLSRWDML